ncbi:hypothetical protein [Streptomyces sp. ISL-11]|uniref:hypothetical protein n=1 Tax=Streptomyces sp. ISL-11 TaxID=2819174 RepID=UPI001BE80DB2|nr:hypothetical protein [Streptomyces sp. ISL-11]MBT2387780.1 hypothetical protein [Streptomyces sp. ISL-11]
MTLRVQPVELERYAGQVRRAADDAHDMLAYARRFTKISAAQAGLLARKLDQHEELRGNVLRVLRHLTEILKGSAGELDASASFYRRTDRSVAASMDAVHPAEGR